MLGSTSAYVASSSSAYEKQTIISLDHSLTVDERVYTYINVYFSS